MHCHKDALLLLAMAMHATRKGALLLLAMARQAHLWLAFTPCTGQALASFLRLHAPPRSHTCHTGGGMNHNRDR